MNNFKEARQNKANGFGYYSNRLKVIWQNKNVPWNWFAIRYGIRHSDIWQLSPIWNMSHNEQRSLMFGFWKLYFQVVYHRNHSFNQNRKFLFRDRLWKFYQLID